jgi:hypothetical protein
LMWLRTIHRIFHRLARLHIFVNHALIMMATLHAIQDQSLEGEEEELQIPLQVQKILSIKSSFGIWMRHSSCSTVSWQGHSPKRATRYLRNFKASTFIYFRCFRVLSLQMFPCLLEFLLLRKITRVLL